MRMLGLNSFHAFGAVASCYDGRSRGPEQLAYMNGQIPLCSTGQYNRPKPPTKPGVCPMDIRRCPDGSAVRRIPPACTFSPCPPSKPPTPPTPPKPVICPQDIRSCPDGSAVRRVPPSCTFSPCPPPKPKPTPKPPGLPNTSTGTIPGVGGGQNYSWEQIWAMCQSSDYQFSDRTICAKAEQMMKPPVPCGYPSQRPMRPASICGPMNRATTIKAWDTWADFYKKALDAKNNADEMCNDKVFSTRQKRMDRCKQFLGVANAHANIWNGLLGALTDKEKSQCRSLQTLVTQNSDNFCFIQE